MSSDKPCQNYLQNKLLKKSRLFHRTSIFIYEKKTQIIGFSLLEDKTDGSATVPKDFLITLKSNLDSQENSHPNYAKI